MTGTALIGGTMIGGLLLAGGPKPVDVRQVQASSGPEPVLSATYTTSVLVVGPATTPPPPPPPPLPPPPPVTREPAPDVTTAVVASPRSPESTRFRPPRLEDLTDCDDDYSSDRGCVPWLFPLLVDQCDWLRSRGSWRIEVRGVDRHRLDRNRDGIACGDGDR